MFFKHMYIELRYFDYILHTYSELVLGEGSDDLAMFCTFM